MTNEFDTDKIWRMTDIGWSVKRDSYIVHGYNLFVLYDKVANVYMGVTLRDYDTKMDVAIRTLNVHPESIRGKGYGRRAVKELITVMATESVAAVQVLDGSDGFWLKIGFVPVHNLSNDYHLQNW